MGSLSAGQGLASWAGSYLSALWKTRVLCPPHMQGFMVNVVLPTNSSAAAALLQQRLDIDYDTYIVVVPLGGSDVIYTRLSAQVYLQRCKCTCICECRHTHSQTHALADTRTPRRLHQLLEL